MEFSQSLASLVWEKQSELIKAWHHQGCDLQGCYQTYSFCLKWMGNKVFVHTGMLELWKNTQADLSTLLIFISVSLQVLQWLKPAKRTSFTSAVVVPWLPARWLIYGICRVQRSRLTTSSIYSSGATTHQQSLCGAFKKNNKLKSIIYFCVRVCLAWHLIVISLFDWRTTTVWIKRIYSIK